ncbi:hypothetical protein ACGC1H_006501 [Rhizoctonia solani]
MEMILPYDFKTFDRGSYILDIPDAKLSDLLQKLRQKKGSNIVSDVISEEPARTHTSQALITDCYHMHPSVRGGNESTRVRNSYDPTKAGLNKLVKAQVYTYFSDSDESSPPSPIHLAPGREEPVDDAGLSGSSPLPPASSNTTQPLEDAGANQDETSNDPTPSSEPSGDSVAKILLDKVEDALASPSQDKRVLPDVVKSDTLNSLLHTYLLDSDSDELPHPSPIHPAPGGDEPINDTALSGSSPLPPASSNTTRPLEAAIKSQDETPDGPIPSSEFSTTPSQDKHVFPGAAKPYTLKFQGMEHQKSLDSNKSGLLRIHGLIIGIDEYMQSDVHPALQGCVGDAKSMLNYFRYLGTLEDHFRCLYNEGATRDAILNAVIDLINNPDIKPHDPIVIYFAGHGDRMPAPRGWQSPNGLVEMILPHDAGSFDVHGHYIHGIPDLTLAFLLYKLSQEKGNNITVILDCCHSGSGTRGEVRSRNSHDSDAPPISNELDARLRKSLGVNYPSLVEHNITAKQPSVRLGAPSLETHVLLAACREDEVAQETQSGGIFTNTLLDELYKCDLATTSYTSLIRSLLTINRLKVPLGFMSQTFQCEGRNQDRILFSLHHSISKGNIALIPTKDKSVYRVRVGRAQGIVPGTEFGVFYGKMDPTSSPLALLVARDVGSVSSHLHSLQPNAPPEIPENAYATIIRYNDHSNGVQIWVDDTVKQDALWESVLTSLNSLPIYWATSPENHDLALLPSNNGVELQGSHMTPGQIETSHIIERGTETQQLVAMLTAIVYFYFHLKIQNKDAPIRDQLSMMLRELNEKDSSWGSIIYEPKGYNLFGDSISAGTVTTLYPNSGIFGLELVNNSTEDFYPYVLYYDFKDYSVGCLYEPPGRSVKAPLQAGKSLTVGYGSGGYPPFQINFTDPTSDKECGAFVLLVFGEWVDIAYLQQESPFGEGTLSPSRGAYAERHLRSQIWDSLVVRVELLAKAKGT